MVRFWTKQSQLGRSPQSAGLPDPADARTGPGFGGRDGSTDSSGEKRKTSVDMQDREGEAKKVKT